MLFVAHALQKTSDEDIEVFIEYEADKEVIVKTGYYLLLRVYGYNKKEFIPLNTDI